MMPWQRLPNSPLTNFSDSSVKRRVGSVTLQGITSLEELEILEEESDEQVSWLSFFLEQNFFTGLWWSYQHTQEWWHSVWRELWSRSSTRILPSSQLFRWLGVLWLFLPWDYGWCLLEKSSWWRIPHITVLGLLGPWHDLPLPWLQVVNTYFCRRCS